MGMKIHLETRKIKQISEKSDISLKNSECKYLYVKISVILEHRN